MENTLNQKVKNVSGDGCRVLMVSADPAFFDARAGTGDALERHRKYAERIDSLDIIVLGGTMNAVKKINDKFTVYAAGRGGLFTMRKTIALGKKITREKKISLLVTQDPHATGFVGVRLKRRFQLPLIIHMHGDFWNNAHWRSESWRNRVKDYVQRSIVRHADALRVVSEGIRGKLLASGIPSEKIFVIHTPINDVLFASLTDTQKLLLEELRYKYQNRFILLFCGRLVAAKNLLFTLSVVRDLHKMRPEILLLIVGDGDQREQLKKSINEQHMEQYVVLLGSQLQDKLVVYYHLAHVLLLLSTNESFGKVIIEAGLAGTPTLASNTSGASHIIQDGTTGFLIPIHNHEAALDVLNEMIDQPEQTKQLGEWAQARYREQYASEKTIEHIVSLWKQVSASK